MKDIDSFSLSLLWVSSDQVKNPNLKGSKSERLEVSKHFHFIITPLSLFFETLGSGSAFCFHARPHVQKKMKGLSFDTV